MPEAGSAQKVCMVCGEDVSGKPRVKDAKGRYLCKGECEAEMARRVKSRAEAGGGAGAARSGAASASVATGSMMDQLLSSSPMLTAVNCAGCNAPMAKDAVICTRCGFNKQAGKALKTRVVVEKAAKQGPSVASKLSSGTLGILLSPLVSGMILIVLYCGLGVVAMYVEEARIPVYLLFGISNLVCTIWAISEAFSEGEHTMAGLIVFQLSAFIPFSIIRITAIIGFLAMCWYILITSENGRLKGLFLAGLLGSIAPLIALLLQES